jgi:hypothetical protein
MVNQVLIFHVCRLIIDTQFKIVRGGMRHASCTHTSQDPELLKVSVRFRNYRRSSASHQFEIILRRLSLSPVKKNGEHINVSVL